MLTWEFPPFISGGLGMACYGLTKALLEKGVKADLLLPTTEDVYFPLNRTEDVDSLPMVFLTLPKKKAPVPYYSMELNERLRAVGLSPIPESYITPGFNFEKVLEYFWLLKKHHLRSDFEKMSVYLRGQENIFKKVQEFTALAIRHAHSFSCDVIHVHDWLAYPAGILLKDMLRKPLVAHIHATEFDRAGGVGDERIHNIEYAGLMAADRVVAVSQYTARMIMDRYAIPSEKIDVVHNAFSVSADASYHRRKIFKDPLILFMGRITIQKGPDYFIEVARKVLDRYPKARFVMAGTGDMFQKMLRRSAMKKMRDRFLFTGFLDREKVERILTATDIFVLPSVSEPFGIAPLEAMAFGSVAIVSKQSGVAEVVKNAFVVDFWDVEKTTDIIVELLEEPAKREKIAKAGQKEVMAIGWRDAATRLHESYRKALCSI